MAGAEVCGVRLRHDPARTMDCADPLTHKWILLAILLLQVCPLRARSPAELAPTVMVNGFGDLEGTAPWSSLPVCQYIVQRSKAFNNKGISFALAVFALAPDEKTIDYYAYKDAQGNLLPASAPTINRWTQGLTSCFRYALAQGFKRIHVLGHVDPLHPVLNKPTIWRNLLMFDPMEKYGGYSYEDVMLNPVTKALSEVVQSDTEVYLSVSGEMGLTNFVYPDEWLGLLQSTKRAVGAAGKKAKVVKAAATINWQMVCGCVEPLDYFSFDPLEYNRTFPGRWSRVKQYALPMTPPFKALLDAGDYLGVSAYGSGYPVRGISKQDMEAALYTLAFELRFFGINLKEFMSKEVLLVEMGLGGTFRFNMPAPDLATVAKYPYSGNWPVGGYTKEVDPWIKPSFRDYRRAFYKAYTDYLQSGGIQFRVDQAYVWSVGSFDVFGVHPVSTSRQGSFADQNIINMIRDLNAKAQ